MIRIGCLVNVDSVVLSISAVTLICHFNHSDTLPFFVASEATATEG